MFILATSELIINRLSFVDPKVCKRDYQRTKKNKLALARASKAHVDCLDSLLQEDWKRKVEARLIRFVLPPYVVFRPTRSRSR